MLYSCPLGGNAHRGDVVGIEVQLFADFEGQALVTFSLNERKVAQATMSPEGREIYPYVAMGYKGARVKAKVIQK